MCDIVNISPAPFFLEHKWPLVSTILKSLYSIKEQWGGYRISESVCVCVGGGGSGSGFALVHC